ncbi:MAG: coiled-coil domain-containing protein [Proteobacteria bacterium]|nr:coiled-coil domain-containing protein [Pseudomonadota bacterium]
MIEKLHNGIGSFLCISCRHSVEGYFSESRMREREPALVDSYLGMNPTFLIFKNVLMRAGSVKQPNFAESTPLSQRLIASIDAAWVQERACKQREMEQSQLEEEEDEEEEEDDDEDEEHEENMQVEAEENDEVK